MSVTTKTGDKGQTSLLNGQRVSKADLRVAAYGDIDELSSIIGVALAQLEGCPDDAQAEELLQIQRDLFALAADFADPVGASFRIGAEQVQHLENAAHQRERALPPQRCFILPGGHVAAANLHQARTVCRRCERQAVALSEREKVSEHGLIYLNRLSDYLFIAARSVNNAFGIADTKA